jgi:hypothetical protein
MTNIDFSVKDFDIRTKLRQFYVAIALVHVIFFVSQPHHHACKLHGEFRAVAPGSRGEAQKSGAGISALLL